MKRASLGKIAHIVLSISLIALFLLPLNGCWDRREVESLALVQALGLDLAADQKNLTVSTMIAIPPKIISGGGQGGGGGGSETGAFIISMDAPTIYEAFNRINTTVNRDITLLQNEVILIGEDLARKGIRNWMDTLVRFREMRRTELIFVCKGKAADILTVQPKLEKNPAEYYLNLVGENRKSGMFPEVRIQELLGGFEAYAQEMYAPLFEKYQRQEPGKEAKDQSKKSGGGDQGQSSGGDKDKKEAGGASVRLVGTALFKKDKMVDSFDIYESQMMLMLLGQFKQAYLTIDDPKKKQYLVSFRLFETAQPNISYRRQRDADQFRVKLKLEAELMSIQSGVDYTDSKLEKILANHIAANLNHRMAKVIAKAQRHSIDVFGFGIKVRETFLTDRDWTEYQWPRRFRDAQVADDIKVALRRVGVQFQPPQNR